ncbi:MAG: amidohydrolase family protein [Candidatus Paceibacterota bacterium]
MATFNEIKKFVPLFSFNLRDESHGFIMALKEILDITGESKIETLITGLKVQNTDNFVYFEEALKLIDNANLKRNNNIHFSLYPYEYTCRPLITFMPDWLTIGDEKNIKENLSDKDIVKKLIKELKQNKGFYKKLVLIDIDNQYKMLKGKSLEQIAKNMSLSIEEALIKVMLMTQKKIIVLNPNLSSINVDKGIKHNASIIASNGMSLDEQNLNNGFIDQRSVGSFVKYLSTYKNILSFETLIHKITGSVRNVMGLNNKGHIKIGMDADLVILNVNNLIDRSTIQNTAIDPKGIETVIINGQLALENGQIIDHQAGRVIIKGE